MIRPFDVRFCAKRQRMIFQRIKNEMTPGTALQGGSYTIKGFTLKRNGEPTLVYCIRSRTAKKQSQKNIPQSKWEQAHMQLMAAGKITRRWFNLARKRQPCDFSVIGKVFVHLGIADERPAEYVLRTLQ